MKTAFYKLHVDSKVYMHIKNTSEILELTVDSIGKSREEGEYLLYLYKKGWGHLINIKVDRNQFTAMQYVEIPSLGSTRECYFATNVNLLQEARKEYKEAKVNQYYSDILLLLRKARHLGKQSYQDLHKMVDEFFEKADQKEGKREKEDVVELSKVLKTELTLEN